jgi:hypothetical protein
MNKIKPIIIVSLIVIVYVFYSWYAYDWHIRFLNQPHIKKSYMVFSLQKDENFIFKPLTFFKPYVYRIGLVEKRSIQEIGKNIYLKNDLWINKYESADRLEGDELYCLIDCNNYKSGDCFNGKELQNIRGIDLQQIKWRQIGKDDSSYDTYMETMKNECSVVSDYLNK